MADCPEPFDSQAHFAALVQSSSDAIVSKDLDGVVCSWNKAAERMFGWTAPEMIGQSIRRLIPDDRSHEEDEILARIRAGDLVPKLETLRLHKDGRLVPVALTISPIRDSNGNIVGASKIAHDTRHQVLLQSELQTARQQFETLANSIPQLAWMADGKGDLFWYNQRWYDYTGTSLEEMAGWGWKKVHHPDHVDRVVERVQHSWDTGEEWEDTFPLRGTDGRYRWFLSRALPVRDEDGTVRLWCGTNTDVTDQREREERIELLMGEVNHRAKNMLATVLSIIHRTAGDAEPQLVATLERRIAALAANQDLLTRSGWAGARMGHIVDAQLAHVTGGSTDRVSIAGPAGLMLTPHAAETLGLAIHELATNAAKYGSLSSPAGRLLIDWQVSLDSFHLHWTEVGGPRVTPPETTGFGTILTKRNPEAALGGKVTIDYRPEGLFWKLDAPTRRILADPEAAG